MSRFLPAQIKTWTSGLLVQSPEKQNLSDHFYRGISTDSRQLKKGEIFLALKGERFDGHDFVTKAAKSGAGLLVMDEKSELAMELYHRLKEGEDLPDLLLVPDTLLAYQQIAAGFRQTLLASLIAITGSVGKTTTRRMISTVVSAQLCVHETQDNQNNQIGVPLTLLEADDDDDVIVAELGMDRRGEIEILSKLSRPDISIITSIGYSHAEYLGSRENILKEKTDIISGMKSNGLILINGQDDMLNAWASEKKDSISVWRICNSKEDAMQLADPEIPCFYAEDVVVNTSETHFRMRSSVDPEADYAICIPVPGLFLVRAALFALAAAYALGLDMEVAARACSNFRNTGSRQLMVRAGHCLILDDSYNASPESMSMAIDTFGIVNKFASQRIACLGGMRELGSYARAMHLEVGKKLAGKDLDAIYLAVPEALWIQQGLEEAGSKIPSYVMNDSEDIAEALLPLLQDDAAILLKGSRSYRMELIREAIEANARAKGLDVSINSGED